MDSTLAIAMELVEGTPLRELCGKPLPIREVIETGQQIAEALAAAHACGTIHGDIKPENILLRRDRYVKVLDFGLARKVTTETLVTGGMLRGVAVEAIERCEKCPGASPDYNACAGEPGDCRGDLSGWKISRLRECRWNLHPRNSKRANAGISRSRQLCS